MKFIDSHAHLDMRQFDRDRDQAIGRAQAAGLCAMVNVGIDLTTSIDSVELAQEHAFVYAAVGWHPHDAASLEDRHIDSLVSLARASKVVGFGEIGLDYFRLNSPRDTQLKRFDDLLSAAAMTGLPVIVHIRDAYDDAYARLRAMSGALSGGVIHCFSSNIKTARKFIDLGFMISIPGTVTFPQNAELKRVVEEIDIRHLLIETDSPFLAPQPFRGKRNEPAHVVHAAAEIARLKGIGLEETAAATTANAVRLFGLEL